jgi:GDPmannose 4,6-dehydratase/GDP-4-dehydro-6-deoxy-D-mannose reductase
MRKFKKVLITGISGSGGSYLAEHILSKKIKTKVYGFMRANNKFNTKNLSKVTMIRCDLTNYKNLKKNLKKIKPDCIFHLASIADVRLSFDQPKEVIENNNSITLNLLESIRTLKLNPTILICSSSEVYGQVSKKYLPISEECPFRPASPYAVSKTFQDIVSYNYYLNFNLKIIITRMFTYFNARRTNLFASHWADQVAKIELGKAKHLLHGNLNSVRTVIDIKDAMEAYWIAACKGRIGEIYNLGGTTTVNIGKFLKVLKKKAKVPIVSFVDKKLLRRTDVTLQIPDTKKFYKHTGWKPKVSFNTSIETLLNEFRLKNKNQ